MILIESKKVSRKDAKTLAKTQRYLLELVQTNFSVMQFFLTYSFGMIVNFLLSFSILRAFAVSLRLCVNRTVHRQRQSLCLAAIRTMATAGVATVTAFQMIGTGKDHIFSFPVIVLAFNQLIRLLRH